MRSVERKGNLLSKLQINLTTQTRRTGATNVQIKLLENETQQLPMKRKRLSQEFFTLSIGKYTIFWRRDRISVAFGLSCNENSVLKLKRQQRNDWARKE